MKAGMIAAAVLLAAVMICGSATAHLAAEVSIRYAGAAEEMLALCESEHWVRAAETVQAYSEQWDSSLAWLQALVSHEDTDRVSLSLRRLRAAIGAREIALCRLLRAELQEYALQIRDRENLTWGNVL